MNEAPGRRGASGASARRRGNRPAGAPGDRASGPGAGKRRGTPPSTARGGALGGASAHADHPSFGLGTAAAGPITTRSPETLPGGRRSAGLRFEHLAADAFSDVQLEALALAGEEPHSLDSLQALFVGLAYGLADDLGVSATLPWIRRDDIREAHPEDGAAELHFNGDADGVGDLEVLLQYRFLDDATADVQAAVVGGVRAPTGETRERAPDGTRLEQEFQPGSGSWDPRLGVAALRRLGALSLTASALYAIATEGAQATDLGDALGYNLALGYRLGDSAHDHGHDHAHAHLAWDLALELNGEWRDQQKVSGVTDTDSAGNTIFLAPGIRVSGGGWSGFAALGLPIVQNLNGRRREASHRLQLGLAKGF